MKIQLLSKIYKQLNRSWWALWKRDDGANLVLMALVIPLLIGFAGLAVDGSNIYYQTQRIQISADAAALGGARKLASNADYAAVNTEIRQLALANAAEEVAWSYINNNRGVHVVASRTVPAYFASIYGYKVFTVSAEAEAQYETVAGAGGLFPFTIDCNCPSDENSNPGGAGGNGNGNNQSSPTATPTPISNSGNPPTSGTVEIASSQSSSYAIRYVGQTGNTWTYEISEVKGQDLNYWLLGMQSCLSNVVSSTPSGATVGADASTGQSGIKWSVTSAFTSGSFSFTLNDNYPSGEVSALAMAGTQYGTVPIRGPICGNTNNGNGNNNGNSGTTSLCLPTIDFETDTAGAALVAGQIIDTEWAAWGMYVTTNSPSSAPAMIFNSANPTGGDTDLGSPNAAFGGPGVGVGGGSSMPGSNGAPLGKVLIVAENNNSANPDDNANGGTLIFTFDYAVRIDEVRILDIDDNTAAGTIKAYSDKNGNTLIASSKMLGLGDNSVQTVGVNALGVRRLEIKFPQSGSVASIVSCRETLQPDYDLGNLIWSDTNSNNVQDSGELGIAGVDLELYVSGQTYGVATATTNVGGEYLFRGLPAGNYEIKIASANFATGKPLAGATYATPNIGSNANLDSNFSSSTGKAAAAITNASNFTVDGGFRLPVNAAPDPGAQSAVITVNDNKNSKFEISLVSMVNNTWTYRVREISGHNLDRWDLGIVNCIDKIVSKNPTTGYAADSTGSSGFAGIRWDVGNSFSDGTFSFTLSGSYQARPRQARVSSINTTAQVSISAPDCSIPTTAPAGTSTPTPVSTPASTPVPTSTSVSAPSGGAVCNCEESGGFVIGQEYVLHEPQANAPGNFGWLRWSGDNTSAPDLEYNIRYPWESDVVMIGDYIKGTTGQTNSSGVANALEQWIGKNVTIPIYDQVTGTGSNVLYRVCAFAVFELGSWDRQSKTMTGRFVRTLVRSDITNYSAPDLGARDVRMVR